MLTREVFDHHLETLTNRKQENGFEHFARRLAEKEICPNLIPQTGPTGGGDSKTDSETYPVADSIALRWYEGIGREASQERWAFAFSAKKKWRQKIQDDVKKIVGTKREYKLIYFITNQFVKDKDRSQVEDDLSKKYKNNIRIMDRTWIMTVVFEHKRIPLAIETLGLTNYDENRYKKTGPRDIEHQTELEDLEQQISDPDRYKGVEYQLAEDCLQASLLARNLELPRVEVEGRFSRAEQIANKFGIRHQKLRVLYAKAWTAYWWYDDFDELSRLYDKVEECVIGTDQADDIELLCNLWMNLRTAVYQQKLTPDGAKLESRTDTLKKEVLRLGSEDNRPSNALQARTNGVLMDLTLAVSGNPEELDRVLNELKAILLSSEGLVSYPFMTVTTIIRELGDHITDSIVYDSLFEYVVDQTSRRTSEAEAGRAFLQRGLQKLKAGKSYDAIRLLGRAQQMLAMDEHRGEWITALGACSSAYEAVGLLWAARSSLLAASNIAFSAFVAQGNFTPRALICLRRLVWIEMKLGRVPCALAWYELMSGISRLFNLDEDAQKSYMDDRSLQDRIFGILLLNIAFSELKWLDFLPEILDQLQLDTSRMVLLYILGYEERLRLDGIIPEDEDSKAVLDFFSKLKVQPAAKELSSKPELMRGLKVRLRSVILGCEFEVESANNFTSIFLSEAILSALEAFLATSVDARVYPHCASFRISIGLSTFSTDLPVYEFDITRKSGDLKIRHSATLDYHSKEKKQAFQMWLIELLAQIIGRVFAMKDPGHYLECLARDEAGFGRALLNSDVSIAITNILGSSPKFLLSAWETKAIQERFPLQRSVPWNNGIENKDESQEHYSLYESIATGEAPEGMFDTDKLKHKDIKISSLINVVLWNRAKWKATAYIVLPEHSHPPIISLCFADADAGKAIFDELRTNVGNIDTDEQIRVVIITGVDKNKPYSYKVLIGVNPKMKKEDDLKYMVLVSRFNRMDPTDHTNLDRFIERYNHMRHYVLLPAHFTNDAVSEIYWNLGIIKRDLYVRPAWQIGENDPDLCALCEEDNPIIPDDVREPPIIRALERIAKMSKR